MQIKDIIAVSGIPGLSKLITSRNNGLVLEDLDTGKSKFYSVRKHQFTPLETVSIYTMVDTVELRDVLKNIYKKDQTGSIPSSKSSNNEIASFFEEVLPDYDRDRVYPSDMKKILKWYDVLKKHDLLESSDEEE